MEDEHHLRIGSEHDILTARQRGRELASAVGFSGSDLTIVATAISEIARNILEYAREGEIVFTLVRNGPSQGIVVVARDEGPGIPDVALAMSVAAISGEGHTMSWLGVGNVEGSLFRRSEGSRPSRESLLLRGGVVGYQLPKLLPSVVPVDPGDTLVFVTDGIGGYPLDGP